MRGPQSGLYGSDAIGGVINQSSTKKGQGPLKVNRRLEGGSFGTLNQLASASGSELDLRLCVQYRRISFDGHAGDASCDQLLPGGRRISNAYENLEHGLDQAWRRRQRASVPELCRPLHDIVLLLHRRQLRRYDLPDHPSPTRSQQIDHDFYTRGEAVTSFFDDRWKNYIGINYTDAWSLNTVPDLDTENNLGKRIEFNDRSVIEALPGETVVLGVDHYTDTLWQNDPYTNVSQN